MTDSSDFHGPIPAAAIVDDRSVQVDPLLARIVGEQQAAGRRIRGCLMKQRAPGGTGCAAEMILVDIDTAQEYLVSQPLGSGSTGCRADPEGFARASEIFRSALAQAPDLVVSNRFGDLEAQRRGFTQELLAVMAQGIPLLTTVATRNVDAWRQVTGGAQLLPPDAAAITAWIERVLCAPGERAPHDQAVQPLS